MIKEAIIKIVAKEDLTKEEAYAVMNEIMDGKTTPTQNAAFLAALSTKSARAETADEIAGCAQAMREHAIPVDTGMDVLEIVGTGGDHSGSFNISTTAAILAASAGAKVAKHGNRAASSLCGTADCLEALGVSIEQDPQTCVKLLQQAGMCFFFAQKYHTSMRYVGPIRKELGIRTVFNILGPLTNPARPAYALLGVYDRYLLEPIARVLIDLGVKRGLVVSARDGMDEITLTDQTDAILIEDGTLTPMVIDPKEYGLELCDPADLKGAQPQDNAKITVDILSGQETSPKRDVALLNAGAALFAAGRACSIGEGIDLARAQIESGQAMNTLKKITEISREGA